MSEQNLAALKTANRIRTRRAAAWRELRDVPRVVGLLGAAELMERPIDEILTATVFDMLRQPHNMGKSYARKMVRRVGMSELTTIGGATDRQRKALCDLLRGMRGTVEVVDLAPSRVVEAKAVLADIAPARRRVGHARSPRGPDSGATRIA